MSRCRIVFLVPVAFVAFASGVAHAQYPSQYCPQPVSPYAYPGPANPARQTQEVLASPRCGALPPASVYHGPTYSSFYDPILYPPRLKTPWDRTPNPFMNGFYSYYYTPAYFRY